MIRYGLPQQHITAEQQQYQNVSHNEMSHNEKLMLAYKISEYFAGCHEDGKTFCLHLLSMNSTATVQRMFGNAKKYDYPVLDCVCEWIFVTCPGSIDQNIRDVNIAFRKCGRNYEIRRDEFRKNPFQTLPGQTNTETIAFEEKNRREIYQKLSKETSKQRYMAHFLIPYNAVKRIEQDCHNNSTKFSMSVLEEWEVTTSNNLRTWQHLKSILTFLGLNNLIDQVEGVKREEIRNEERPASLSIGHVLDMLLVAVDIERRRLLRSYDCTNEHFHVMLEQSKSKLIMLKHKGVLGKDFWKILFPKLAQSNPQDYDLTLINILLKLKGEEVNKFITSTRNKLAHMPFGDQMFLERTSEKLFHFVKKEGCEEDIAKIFNIQKSRHVIKSFSVEKEEAQNKCCEEGVTCNLKAPLTSHVKREFELQKLYQNLKSQCKLPVVVSGLGGIGKSEFLRCFGQNFKIYFDNNILWLNAENDAELLFSLHKHAEHMKIKTNFNAVNETHNLLATAIFTFFEKIGKKFLVVFDNFNDSYEKLQALLPSTHLASVVVTTQQSQWGDRFITQPLESFTPAMSKLLLKQNLKEQVFGTNNVKSLEDLCKELDNFPLALQQAIAYIKKERITISSYIKLFKKYKHKLLERKHDDDFYQHTVATTWSMALLKLQQSGDQSAIDLFSFMAYMSGEDIDIGLFSFCYGPPDLRSALDILEQYSLVKVKEDGMGRKTICLHKLLQHVVRQKMQNKSGEIMSKLLELLGKAILQSPIVDCDTNFCSNWLHHLRTIFDLLLSADECQKNQFLNSYKKWKCDLLSKLSKRNERRIIESVGKALSRIDGGCGKKKLAYYVCKIYLFDVGSVFDVSSVLLFWREILYVYFINI
ncbi:uncharacterized protein LOC130626087 [Hydractinia symbiolongicarpus]|uniref:uncharacterized protein LOC130626087 n=1 Tax=Hydractinia symbiolongicarpus TaxID=13093 RepID=UPI002550D9D6|nr:uncharacterized protein LOC130626087 [Hydractinia symbiolongicarpus]